MNQLPPELTRLPLNSLDVLRYMGRASLERADRDTLAEGAGMSERGIGQAIRGLVTKGYLNMDDGYIYYLTEKGQQAVADIQAYDAAQPNQASKTGTAQAIQQLMVAVSPYPMSNGTACRLQFGLDGAPQVADRYQLILRLSATSGAFSPNEVTLELYPNQPVTPAEAHYTPAGNHGMVRIRVEALQLIDMDVHSAGGIFFDVPLTAQQGERQGWYGKVNLQS